MMRPAAMGELGVSGGSWDVYILPLFLLPARGEPVFEWLKMRQCKEGKGREEDQSYAY